MENLVREPAIKYQKATKGISKSDFLAIVSSTGLNLTQFSKLLPASKRTIEKTKDQDLLSPTVSDRVLQIASLYQFGSNVLGDNQQFQAWLQAPLIALGGKKPIDFINNGTGISMINDLLGRIEQGVYS